MDIIMSSFKTTLLKALATTNTAPSPKKYTIEVQPDRF